jgi:hypothetical protein
MVKLSNQQCIHLVLPEPSTMLGLPCAPAKIWAGVGILPTTPGLRFFGRPYDSPDRGPYSEYRCLFIAFGYKANATYLSFFPGRSERRYY